MLCFVLEKCLQIVTGSWIVKIFVLYLPTMDRLRNHTAHVNGYGSAVEFCGSEARGNECFVALLHGVFTVGRLTVGTTSFTVTGTTPVGVL